MLIWLVQVFGCTYVTVRGVLMLIWLVQVFRCTYVTVIVNKRGSAGSTRSVARLSSVVIIIIIEQEDNEWHIC